MVRLSVIVVSYNVRPFLAQTLRTVKASLKHIDHEIWVVDNASKDDTVEWVRRHHPDVKCHASTENLGFSKANNWAIERASGEYVALVNPDTLIQEDTFSTCLDYMDAHPDAGMAGCRINNGDGTLQLACRRSFPTPWVALTKILGLSAIFPKSRLFGRYNLTYLDENSIEEVEAISGSFMVIRRKILQEVGGLDEQFFMYGEDLDLCYRIHQSGWKIVYLPATQIVHYKGQSALQAGFKNLIDFYEAMRLFVSKHFQHGWLWLPSWLLIAGIALRGGLSLVHRVIRPWIKPAFDAMGLQAGLLMALLIRFGSIDNYVSYGPVNALYTLLWLFMCLLSGRYRDARERFERLAVGMALGTVLNTSLTFFLPQYAFSRQVLVSMGLLAFGLLSLADWLSARLKSRKQSGGAPQVMMVGQAPSLIKFGRMIAGLHPRPYHVSGFVTDETVSPELKSHDILGGLEDVPRLLDLHKVDQLIFPFESGTEKAILHALQWRRHRPVTVKMTEPVMEAGHERELEDVLSGLPLKKLSIRIDEPYYRLSKRFIDLAFVGATALPVLLSRVMALTGMTVGPRWIRTGQHWWPVLRGRMSWVGSPQQSQHDSAAIGGHVHGMISPAGQGTPQETLAALTFYHVHYSPWMDLKLISRYWLTRHKA